MYEPMIGPDDFEGVQCDLDEHLGESLLEPENGSSEYETRDEVVKITMYSIVAAVGATGVYGLLTSDWIPLSNTWAVGAAPFGAIITKYVG